MGNRIYEIAYELSGEFCIKTVQGESYMIDEGGYLRIYDANKHAVLTFPAFGWLYIENVTHKAYKEPND